MNFVISIMSFFPNVRIGWKINLSSLLQLGQKNIPLGFPNLTGILRYENFVLQKGQRMGLFLVKFGYFFF